MAVYNTTNLSEANNFAEMVGAVNTLSGNTLGFSILILVWVFVFLSVQDTNRVKAATASFLTAISGALLTVTGMVSNSVMWISGFLLAVSLVVLYVNARE